MSDKSLRNFLESPSAADAALERQVKGRRQPEILEANTFIVGVLTSVYGAGESATAPNSAPVSGANTYYSPQQGIYTNQQTSVNYPDFATQARQAVEAAIAPEELNNGRA